MSQRGLRGVGWLPLVLVALLVGAAAWFFLSYVPRERADEIEKWRRELSVRADTRSELLDLRMADDLTKAGFVVAFPSVRTLAAADDSRREPAPGSPLGLMLTDFCKTFGKRSVSILGRSGRLLAASDGPPPGSAAVDLAREVIRTSSARVDLLRDPDGTVSLALAVPITPSGQGTSGPETPSVGAVLVVGDPEKNLYDLLRKQPLPAKTSESVLARRDGDSVLYLSPLKYSSAPLLTFRHPLGNSGFATRAAIDGIEKFNLFTDYRGAAVFAATRRMAHAPWGLVIKVDEEEALASFRRDVRKAGISWGAFLLAILGSAWGLWRAREASERERSALTLSETRMRSLFDGMLEGYAYCEMVYEDGVPTDFVYLDVNPAFEKLTGLKDVVGKRVTEVIPGIREANPKLFETYGRVASTGEPAFFEEYLPALKIWFALSVYSTRKGHFVAVFDNITERKRADVRIRQLNRLLKTLSEINGLIVRTDEQETLLSEACRILVEHGGFPMAWIGLADREKGLILPAARAGEASRYLDKITVRLDDTPEGRGPVGTAIRTERHVVIPDLATEPTVAPWRERMLAHGFRTAGVFPFRVRDEVAGTLTVYSSEPGTIGDEETALLDELSGDLGHALATLEIRDAHGRAEEALRESEKQLKSLFENALLGLYRTTPDGAVLMANPCLCRMLGYDSFEELKKRNLEEEGFEPSYSRLEFRRKVEVEGVVMGVEANWKRRDGSFVFLRESATAIRDALGKVLYYEGTVEDITELKLLQAQLVQAQKMEAVGRLAGGVAHDFNNLLAVIQGYGELLARSLAGDPVGSESAGEILRAAERAAALTRQLLAFSGRQKLEMRVLDLGAVVANIEKMLRRLIGEDIELLVPRPAGPLLARVDPGQIEQVLMNLAVNSRDAMPKGGRLTFRVEALDLDLPLLSHPETVPPGRYVVLRVDDTGCGMDAETLGHAFEPFFTTKERGKGTGLGLSTVFGIVKQSGGFLDMGSAPGQGTTFRIFFPRAEGTRPTSGARRAVKRGVSETILLVEDEPAVRNLTRILLEGIGYRVLSASDPSEAVAIAERREERIDLLLTDVLMPGMTGPELAAKVRTSRPVMKILFMSGYSADVLEDRGGVENGTALLPKPFTRASLEQKVREVLDGPGPSTA